MALVYRNGRPYYYRTARRAGKVIALYIASGQDAIDICREDQIARDSQAQRDKRLDQHLAHLDSYCRAVDSCLEQAMTHQGFYRYGGQWRKHKKMNLPVNATTHPIVDDSISRGAELTLVKIATGGDELLEGELIGEIAAIERKLSGDNPSPIEQLLIRRISFCHLQLNYFEHCHTQTLEHPEMDPKRIERSMKRVHQAHERYLSSIKALVKVRKLQLPALQFNLAETQLNVQNA